MWERPIHTAPTPFCSQLTLSLMPVLLCGRGGVQMRQGSLSAPPRPALREQLGRDLSTHLLCNTRPYFFLVPKIKNPSQTKYPRNHNPGQERGHYQGLQEPPPQATAPLPVQPLPKVTRYPDFYVNPLLHRVATKPESLNTVLSLNNIIAVLLTGKKSSLFKV